jgi:hypothetical protein
MTIAPETNAETIVRLRAAGWSERRILSVLGLPGFGEAHARRANNTVIELGVSPHAAVLGGPHGAREIAIAREALGR